MPSQAQKDRAVAALASIRAKAASASFVQPSAPAAPKKVSPSAARENQKYADLLDSPNPTIYVAKVPKPKDRIPGVTYVPRKLTTTKTVTTPAPVAAPGTTPSARPAQPTKITTITPNPNVKTEATPENLQAYQHAQFIKNAAAQAQHDAQARVDRVIGPGNDLGQTIEHGVITALDAPRRVAAAGIVAAGGGIRAALGKPSLPGFGVEDALAGDVRYGDIAFGKPGQTAGILKGTVVDNAVGRIAIGTLGDIATDPLTLVAPAESGARVEAILRDPKVVESLAAKGIDALDEAAKVARAGSPSVLSKEVLDAAGLHGAGGLKLAGLDVGGKPLRQGVSEVTSGLRNAARDAVLGTTAEGENWLQRSLRKVGGQSGPSAILRRSGDPAQYRASLLFPIERGQQALGGMIGMRLADDVAAATRDLTTEQFDNVVRLVETAPEGRSAVVDQFKAQGLDRHADAVSSALDRAHEEWSVASRAAGVPGARPYLDQYFPRSKELDGMFKAGTLTGRKQAFGQYAREIKAGSTVFGEVVPEGLSNSGVRDWLNARSVERFGQPFYKLDQRNVLAGYFRNMGTEIGRLRTLAEGQRLGIISRLDARTLYDASLTTPEWQARARGAYGSAASASERGTATEIQAMHMQEGDHAVAQAMLSSALDRGEIAFRNTQAPELVRGLIRTHEPLNLSPEAMEIRAAVYELTKPKNWGGWVKSYDAALNWTKAWQLATPGFVARNLSGGVFNNALAGVALGDYQDWIKANAAFHGTTGIESKAARLVNAGDNPKWAAYVQANPELANAYVQSRAFHQGQFASELGSHEHNVLQTINPVSSKGLLPRFIRDRSENVEGLLRGTLAMKTLREGGDMTAAYEAVAKYHFDYSDLTTVEKDVVKRFVRPYYTWLRRNLPLQIEMLLKHPSLYSKYENFAANLSAGVPQDGVVPQYFTKELLGTATPFKMGGSRVYYTPQLPFADLTQLLDPKGLALEGAPPIFKTPIELFANKQFFKGIPLRSDKIVPLGAWGSWMAPLLAQANLAHKEKGAWVTNEKVAYAITQYAPLIGRARQLAPSEDKFKSRYWPGIVNMLTGLGVRANTPQEQQSELFRRALASGKLKKVTFYQKQKGK